MARRAVEFLRRHPGFLIVAGVVGLVGASTMDRALDDSGSAGSGDDREEARSVDEAGGGAESGSDDDSSNEERGAGDGAQGDAGEATTPDDAQVGPESTTTSTPPDVARPRPDVDVHNPPDGSDPVEVARWWAATHTAYVGAEPASDLVKRLAPLTTPDLRADLASIPPAASYGEPTHIDGVSARESTHGSSPGGAGNGSRGVWVTVETPGALVVYDIVLQREAGGWLVSEANRL